MRASGRHRRRGGKKGLADGLAMAGQVASLIPGAAQALGPFGALLGMEAPPPPPPPPPHASFQGVRAGPMMARRPHATGRGMHKVHHSCPHCGHGKHSAPHVSKHKCRSCGGSFFSSALDFAKKVASHPVAQHLAQAAAPHLMAYAQKKAPGLVSAANRAVGAYHAVNAHPLGHMAVSAARQHVGMGRRRRGPTAHSLAVGRVMREHGMGLAHASRYVKEHGLAHH
jgi:ribosomal protein L37AE/L43A